MSQSIAELCELLIKDNLGDLYATIFSYLFAHGRQPTIRIARATGLTGKQVRHALAVLVQQHLVYHSTSRDDGLTYYEADWRHAYYLVRSGRILQLVQDRLGEYAAKVMEVVMYLGHAKVSYLETMEELIAVPAPAQSHPEGGRKRRRLIDGAGVKQEQEDGQAEADDVGGDIVQDGFTGDQDTEGAAGNPLQLDSEGLHPTLRALASHGFIMRVRDAHFLSPGDLRETAEQSLRARSDIRALKGKRQEEAIASGIEELIRQRTDGRIKAGAPDVRAEARERRRKRAAAADTGPGAAEEEVEKARKRLKVELDDGEDDHLSRAASGAASANDVYGYEGDEDDYDEEVEPMDLNMIVQPDYKKLDVALRNVALINYAREKTTDPTATVYAALLARIETRTFTCRARDEPVPEGEEAEQYSTAVSLQTVIDDLEASGDVDSLGGVFGDPNARAGGGADADADELPSRVRARNVEKHLSFLAQEPWLFTTRNLSSGILSYAVEFRRLARALRHLEIERLVYSQFGSIGVRLLRILAEKGKLDEKRLQEVSLVGTRELRIVLGQMEAAGWLELQEVPRDAQRQAARTLYLWFFDADRVATSLCETCYKSMARLYSRMRVEKAKCRLVLEKTERLDVRGNEERYLTRAELELWEKWKQKEELFLGSITRLDALIAVLRDY